MDKSEIEHDLSLTQFLLDNGFTWKRLAPLLPVPGSWVWAVNSDERVEDIVANIREKFHGRGGCIFTLPGDGSDFPVYAYYTVCSPNEIRKRVELKAFL